MPVQSAEKEVQNCSTCEFGKISMHSGSGYQCGAEVAMTCKPFFLDEPKHWQAINYED